MPPKNKKNKKKNSLLPKENGDADPLNSVPDTPAEEREEFVTPADKLENPLDLVGANGLTAEPAEIVDEKAQDLMAKPEGDEVADAWGLGDDKSKPISAEPGSIDPAGDIPDTFEVRDLDAERAKAEIEAAQEAAATEVVVPPVVTAEEDTLAEKAAGPAVDNPEEVPSKLEDEETKPQVADLDIPDTIDAKLTTEPESETVQPVEPAEDTKVDEAEAAKEAVEEVLGDAKPVAAAIEADPEAPVTAEADPEAPADAVEATSEAPAWPERPLMEEPKPSTLPSLISSDKDFTSRRYQSTTSPHFLNKPHQIANHSLDLDDRNMQSSVNNWYKKIFSFADSLSWRPGWDYLEEFTFFARGIEAPLAQVSLQSVTEWWAEKPKDPSVRWEDLDAESVRYEEFWEWKSKLALSAICTNFACREVFGKTIFALDDKMTKKLGAAMMVFSTDFGDDITATKFRHMTLKLLQESKAFQSATRKKLVQLSQELANVLSPLTSFLLSTEPRSEEEKQQQQHYSPLVLALYEKVLMSTLTLHDTIQKDHKYFALFHPVPGVEFDENTMEETTFNGLGAGKGSVALVARPGLARLGLPRGGEPEDIIIVHKALVVREDALEEGLRSFEPTPAREEGAEEVSQIE